jgi:hypothetical protein
MFASLFKDIDLQAATISSCTFGGMHIVFLGWFLKQLSKIVSNSSMIT